MLLTVSVKDIYNVMLYLLTVPVKDVYITSIGPGVVEKRLENGESVLLEERQRFGVGCVATIEGSVNPPKVEITIDGTDETHLFSVSRESTPVVSTESGLVLYHSQIKLQLIDKKPNPNFNEKILKCAAKITGFAQNIASAVLNVKCKSNDCLYFKQNRLYKLQK